MAGPAPKTEKWTARENLHKPEGLHIIVSGHVEVSDADKAPVLTEGAGGGPEILALDLAIEACSDPAIQVPVWKAAGLHKEVKANEYNRVEVRWDGKPIAKFPVIDDRQRATLMDKQMKALNAVAAKTLSVKPKVDAAKKTVAKKAAKVKKVVKKAAQKVAKKAAKKATKTAKKAAVKKTKKPAKKSALKKFVGKLVKKLAPSKKKKKKVERKGKRR